VTGYCEHGNESVCYTRKGKFFNWAGNICLLRMPLLHGVGLLQMNRISLAVKHHKALVLLVCRPLQRFHIWMIRVISATFLLLNTETMTAFSFWREFVQEFKRKLCLVLCSVSRTPHFLPQFMTLICFLQIVWQVIACYENAWVSHPKRSFKQQINPLKSSGNFT
jgi:hypothetical protein